MAFFADRIDKQAITRLEHLINTPFVRMDYSEAINILKNAANGSNSRWNGDSICSPNTNAI